MFGKEKYMLFSVTVIHYISRLSLILGILYLTFQAFPIIFAGKHGFNVGETGLSFLGVFVGLIIAMASMAYWAPCVPSTRVTSPILI